MSEQPTREQIEEALGSFLNTWEEKVLSWAARQYLASLDASAPLHTDLMVSPESLDKFLDDKPSGSPKDGTREALLEENARLRTMADGVLAPHRLTRIEKLEAAEMRVKELEALQDKRADKSPNPMTRSAREALEEMFDGDIQQADRILSRLAEEGFVVVPREPPIPIIDEMDPRHVSNPGTGAHVLDHRSPPVDDS